jgi:hypothetical protein
MVFLNSNLDNAIKNVQFVHSFKEEGLHFHVQFCLDVLMPMPTSFETPRFA